MKKIFLFVCLLLCFTTTALAQKQEWISKSYDFKKANNVLLEFYYLPPYNGVSENETTEIFGEKVQNIYDNLKKQNYKFYSMPMIAQIIKDQQNIDLAAMYDSEPEKADEIYHNFVKENMDLVVTAEIMVYDIGSQYFDGYFVNLPSVDTSYVTTPYGSGTATTYGNTPHYMSGGNFPVVYCCVRFTTYTMPDGNAVWTRIDDRAKANKTMFENTTPKDVYKRIIGSWASDFENKLERNI